MLQPVLVIRLAKAGFFMSIVNILPFRQDFSDFVSQNASVSTALPYKRGYPSSAQKWIKIPT